MWDTGSICESYIDFFFVCVLVVVFFLNTNLLDFPSNIFGLQSVFQVSQVFEFLPKKLWKSPRTMDKIINNVTVKP